MEAKEFKNGLTVRQLKELIKDWPEVHIDGKETVVRVGCDGVSDLVTTVWPVNLKQGVADLELDGPA